MRNTTLLTLLFLTNILYGQNANWSETDRKYLLDNLTRSRDELVKETQDLTKAQWEFKESPDRWSINQIVEHIAIWELLLSHDISRAYNPGIKPERIKTAEADSTFVNFIYETSPHHSLEYTKPFSYTIPVGKNPLANNLAWFLNMRNESIEFVGKTPDDLRAYFRRKAVQAYILNNPRMRLIP